MTLAKLGSIGAPLTVAGLAARRNRFVLVVVMLLLPPVAAVVWFAHGLWLTVLYGPRPATATEIVAARTQGDNHQWFLLTEQPRYLNVSRLLTNQKPQGPIQVQFFLYVLPGSPSILLEAEHGRIQTPPSASTERTDLQPPVYAWISARNPFDYVRARESAARLGYASLAPFMLMWSNQSPTFTRMVTAIAAAPVAVALLSLLRGLVVAVRGLRDPPRTPSVRCLLRSSRGAEGLDRLVREIDAEAAQAQLPLTFRSPSWRILPSWLIVKFGRLFRLVSTEDMIWIAAYTVTKRLWGLLPVAMSGRIHIVDRFGGWTVLRVPRDLNAALLLQQIHSRAPWAVAGPSLEMKQAFGTGSEAPWWRLMTHRRSRPELVRRVDERRLAILRQTRADGTG
jgi:hypothetical protein